MKLQRYRKPLSVLLSIAMVISLIPSQALAEVLDEVEIISLEAQGELDGPDAAAAEEQEAEGDPQDERKTLDAPSDDAEQLGSPTEPEDANAVPDEPEDAIVDATADDSESLDRALNRTDIELDDDSIQPQAGRSYHVSDENQGVTFYIECTAKTESGGTCELWGINPNASTAAGSLDVTIPAKICGLTVASIMSGPDDAIRSLYIPSTVTTLDSNSESGPFAYKRYLEEVAFASDSQIETVCDSCFFASGLRSLTLPQSVRTIEDDAFCHCINLSEVTLSENLETIGDYAFYNTDLAGIDFPGSLMSIGEHAFATGESTTARGWYRVSYGASDVEWVRDDYLDCVQQFDEVTIPDAVTTIGAGAFDRHEINGYILSKVLDDAAYDAYDRGHESHIATLTLGRKVETIGEEAFWGAPIATLTLPASLTTIEQDAFMDCTELTTVQAGASSLTYLSGFRNCVALESITIPATVATIGDYAFSGCTSLAQDIVISKSTTRVGHFAFNNSGITGLTVDARGADLTFGICAFRGCTGLNGTVIDLPERVTELAGSDFAGLKDVTYYIRNDAIVFKDYYDLRNKFEQMSWNWDSNRTYSLPFDGYDDDYGEWGETVEKTDYNGTYKSTSVHTPDPWGSVYHSGSGEFDPGNSVVYLPETMTKETSLCVWVYKLALEWVLWQCEYNPDSFTDVWPEFRTMGEEPYVPQPPVDSSWLSISTEGDAGTNANVCVFDAAGKLVASETARLGYTLVSGLAAGTYTVVAFAKNEYFSTVGSVSDLSAMGFASSSYATALATTTEGQETEVTLKVPSLDTSHIASLVSNCSVVVPKSTVTKGTEVFACINFQMAEGISATTVKASIPKGLALNSVASNNTNYGTGGFDEGTRELTITLSADDVAATPCRIWLGLTPTAIGRYGISASVVANGIASPVGSATFTTPGVVLKTGYTAVEGEPLQVSVTAAPGTMVSVTAGGEPELLGPTRANGTFVGTVTPKNPGDTLELGDLTLASTVLTVSASVEDDGVTYEDSSDVLLKLASPRTRETLEATLWEFSFVHARSRYYLVDEGSTTGGRCRDYYTYVGNGQEENKYWTFSAVFVAPHEIADDADATVLIEMSDGSLLHYDMARVKSWTEGGKYYAEYTYCAYIEQAGDHVFDDSLIPAAFDVAIDEHWSEGGPYGITQADIDDYRALGGSSNTSDWYLYCANAEQANKAALEELFPGIPQEVMDIYLAGDLQYALFHPIQQEPFWDDIQQYLTDEEIQFLIDYDRQLRETRAALEAWLNFDVPMTTCADLGEWFEKNTHWQHDYTFNEATLKAQGYDVYTDEKEPELSSSIGTPYDWANFTATLSGSTEAAGVEGTGLLGLDTDPLRAPGDPMPLRTPQKTAIKVETDANGLPTGISGADSNGNFYKMALPDSMSDYNPTASEDEMLFIDATAALLDTRGTFSDILAKYVLTGTDSISSSAKSYFGSSAQVYGVASDVMTGYSVYKTYQGTKEGEQRIEDLQKLVDELEKQVDEYRRRDIHEWDVDCSRAMTDLLIAAHKLLITQQGEVDLGRFGMWSTIVTTAGSKIKHPLFKYTFWAGGKLITGACHYTNRKNADIMINERMEYNRCQYQVMAVCDGQPAKLPLRPKKCLDPSGEAYEVTLDNPVGGATATIYQVGNDDPWLAEEYEQVNPQVTDETGRFAWDVTSGEWYVRVEKEGYRASTSDPMPVPPPQLDVNIPMYTTIAPTVAGVSADTQYLEIVFDQYMDCDVPPEVSFVFKGQTYLATSSVWPECVEGDGLDQDGAHKTGTYCKVLQVEVPAGVELGDELEVKVSGAVNYAGVAQAEPDVRTVTVAPRPAKLVLNFEDTISMQAGTSRPATVRVYDKDDNPIEGLSITYELDNEYLAQVHAGEIAKTDADGTTRATIDALLPGLSVLTVSVDGTSLSREVQLLTTVETNQAAMPTATIAGKTYGEGTVNVTVNKVKSGETITLTTATDGATIYYTTDGSCPCQNTKGRKTYTGPIEVTGDTDFIIAAYKEGMDYSEKLHLHVRIATATQRTTWKRLAGSNALDTMQKIAAEFGSAKVAVVTTNADFHDALAASAYAGANGALVLTTAKGSASKQTKAALKAAGVKTVYVVGKTSDVSKAALNGLKYASGVTVKRVADKSGYSTKAIELAKACGTKHSDTVIIATQASFKDALSIAPYSYATKSPILYAETSKKLSDATLKYIKSAGFKKAIIVGGPLALPAGIETQLTSKCGVKAANIMRLAGADPYATSEVIAKWATGQYKNGDTAGPYQGAMLSKIRFQPTTKLNANKLAVSTSRTNLKWKDALCGAALCGKNKSVLLLADDADANGKAKNSYTKAVDFCHAKATSMSRAYVLGGTSAVSEKVYKALEASTIV